MLPNECPKDEIRVEQGGVDWQVIQRDQLLESFDTLDQAIERAVAVFRERRLERLHILILPPESPHMMTLPMALDQDVDIVIQRKPASRRAARIRVDAA